MYHGDTITSGVRRVIFFSHTDKSFFRLYEKAVYRHEPTEYPETFVDEIKKLLAEQPN